MSADSLDNLCAKLGYTFRNIVLLQHEALTHDYSGQWIWPYEGVKYKQKKYYRLKTLGVRVLKLIVAEQAIIELAFTKGTFGGNPPKTLEGKLNYVVKLYLSSSRFDYVALNLSVAKYVKTAKGYNGTLETLYPSIVKAIFGAVFIDAGGCSGHATSKRSALSTVRSLFTKLWRLSKFRDQEDLYLLKRGVRFDNLESKFMCYTEEILIYNYFSGRFMEYFNLEKIIGYKFKDNRILRQALTHDCVRSFKATKDYLNYEILEFLGDAVYELVICEYLYWHYINDDDGTDFNHAKVELYAKKEFQKVLAKCLEIDKYLIKPLFLEITDMHDFLESLVGAIYIDKERSLITVKNTIVRICETFREDILNNDCSPLPYSLKTYHGSHYIRTGDEKNGSGIQSAQASFEIRNIRQFIINIIVDCSDQSDKLEYAKTEEENDHKSILMVSEERYNQLEFERISFYRVLARALENCCGYQAEGSTAENVTPKNRTGYEYESSIPIIQGVSRGPLISESRRPNTQEISNEEAWEAMLLILKWTGMWFMKFLGKAKKLTITLIRGFLLFLGYSFLGLLALSIISTENKKATK